MERAFLDLMPHTVTLKAVTERDTYGVPTLDDGVDVRAHVVPGRRRIVSATGQEIAVRGVAYCAGPDIPDEDGTITVPAALGFPEDMPILGVTVRTDESGAVHNVMVAF